MGFRFRKSINAGPLRINLSKSGIGYSVGTKGLRYTKKAGGGTRTTASIPGTGISYVKDSRKASAAAPRRGEAAPMGGDGSQTPMQSEKPVTGTEVVLAWLLGWVGAHKFYRRKYGMGILYLLTLGLFLFGWIGDSVCLTLRYINQRSGRETTKRGRVISYIASVACVLLLLGSCGTGGNASEQPDPTTTPVVTETTEAATTETAVPETTAPETTVPETTVPETTVPEATVPESTAPETTVPPTTVPEATAPETTEQPTSPTYILNKSTMKVHTPRCASVKDIAAHNYGEFFGTLSEAEAMGYQRCGRCLK